MTGQPDFTSGASELLAHSQPDTIRTPARKYNSPMRRRDLLGLMAVSAVNGYAKSDRVVIAGAGIIGASIAYHLAKRGAQVTVLEKSRPGAGATGKSFAWINAFAKEPRSYFDLNLLGIAGWRRLAIEFAGGLHIQWGGSVQWHTTGAEAERLRRDVRNMEQWGYSSRLIEPSQLSLLLPSIVSGPAAVACFNDQEGSVDPMHALDVVLKRAQQAGAKVEHPCEVTGIDWSNGRVRGVQTTRGPVETDFLVLAAGVDTTRLARMAQVNVPLKESPGLLAHTKPLPMMLERLAMAPGANMKQNLDGRIVTGADFGGSSTTDASREMGEKLLRNAQNFLPRLKDAELEKVTLGFRVLPADDHPIIGFPPRCPNLYAAAMHSGITLAPFIGQLAATEILDGVATDALAPYRPSRFA